MQKTILIVDFEQESLEELQQILQNEEFLVRDGGGRTTGAVRL